MRGFFLSVDTVPHFINLSQSLMERCWGRFSFNFNVFSCLISWGMVFESFFRFCEKACFASFKISCAFLFGVFSVLMWMIAESTFGLGQKEFFDT